MSWIFFTFVTYHLPNVQFSLGRWDTLTESHSAWAASVVREFLFIHNIRNSDATSTEIYDIVWL